MCKSTSYKVSIESVEADWTGKEPTNESYPPHMPQPHLIRFHNKILTILLLLAFQPLWHGIHRSVLRRAIDIDPPVAARDDASRGLVRDFDPEVRRVREHGVDVLLPDPRHVAVVVEDAHCDFADL